ncbi:hypothetical protein EUGRSUZ_J00093 [Eucalyptus grandis]|uniref:non-specific serine/threonine protein kinase n=2 Tax=Eucalyptus grandis TaxID=71139 RepID=A0A059A9H2_EUCGR|nr:hypothetical protein EUGRSUZ_J00093 [Eucalyptus grandis]
MSRHYICSICHNRRPKMGWKRDFAFEELKAATKGFSQKLALHFGVAYREELNGLKITVKQHKNARYHGSEKGFQSEVHMLSEVRHENLAMLLGSCSEGNCRLLVYEYVCNGSLDNHLSRNPSRLLRWDQKMKITLGAAKGLKYLHENNIIHQNLRPDNILLTHDWIGTMPYLAPEYADSSEVSPKSDCYSFGVILLHLITGLRSTDPLFGERSIVKWAKPLLRGKKYPELLEHGMADSYDDDQLRRLIRVADKCLIKNLCKRESMDQECLL